MSLCCEVLPSLGCFERFGKVIFETFDTDKSGFLDFAEFMVGLHITAEGSNEEKYTWAFQMYDLDGDGQIEFKEMKRSVKSIKMLLPTFRLTYLFFGLD